MATVTGYTAERMKEIEDSAIVDGVISGDNLMLTRFDGTQINAGNVRGPQGPQGTTGDTAIEIVTSETRPALPYEGAVIYETDTTYLFKWNGTAWIYIGGPIICTSSTRPTLDLFEGLEIYETDTDRRYIYNGTTWAYNGGVIICTSSARPTANLFDGLKIYETDTKRSYTYNGALWVPASGEMRCRVSRSSAQGVGSGVASNIIWTSQEYDTDNIWTPGGGADSLFIPSNGAGLWEFILNANWAVNPNGVRHFSILKNNAGVATWNDIPSGAWLSGATVAVQIVVAAGDIIKGASYQTSGTVLNIDATYPLTLSGVFLGP